MRTEGSTVSGGVYGDVVPDLPRESAGIPPRTERPPRFQWPTPNPDGPPPGAPARPPQPRPAPWELIRQLGGTPHEVREWAHRQGIKVSSKGIVPYHVVDAWASARVGDRPHIRVRARPDGFWTWACMNVPGCFECGFRTTQPAALAHGLAHLATHTGEP